MSATTVQQVNGMNGVNGKGPCCMDESGLSFIECDYSDPLQLFKEWLEEARSCSCLMPEALCLSTCTLDGKVSSRTLLLRRFEEDGLVIMTDDRSRKVREIRDNPRVSMVFLWVYKKQGVIRTRQVRLEGKIEELRRPQFQDLYDNEPFYCKVRAHICHQDSPTEWEALKEKHDLLVKKVQQKEADLPMPDHFIAFKVYPDFVEFYFGEENHIADRLKFVKDKPSLDWQMERVTA